ncbi:MAG: 3-deoxy-7-phosphoheptulonate synthase [Thermoguttaceae bacterium]
MIIVLKPEMTPDDLRPMIAALENRGLILQNIAGESTRMIGLAGDTSFLTSETLLQFHCVEKVLKVQEPYKLAGRKFHPQDSTFTIGGYKIGGGEFAVIAGPCSVESEEQILSIARDVKKSGATFLRGGAFKPRTSPYSFTGLGLDGLALLKMARQKTGLPIVTEIMSQEHLDVFAEDVDVIQIGARNMQNFTLLRDIGKLKKPVLLKRGFSSTLDELLMSAEYILAGGTEEVILCERGIRTFETATRNTLDLSAIPVLKTKTHLPVVVDPSHATGHWSLVESMSYAAVAAGADGLIIEVHNQPERALCDGAQSITPEVFHRLMHKIKAIRKIITE